MKLTWKQKREHKKQLECEHDIVRGHYLLGTKKRKAGFRRSGTGLLQCCTKCGAIGFIGQNYLYCDFRHMVRHTAGNVDESNPVMILKEKEDDRSARGKNAVSATRRR